MAIKNAKRIKWTVEKVNNNPVDIILEVGSGPGVAFKAVASKITTGHITGVDHSEVICKQASNRNSKYIANGKANIICGTVWDIDTKNKFNIIFGSNVHFFCEKSYC